LNRRLPPPDCFRMVEFDVGPLGPEVGDAPPAAAHDEGLGVGAAEPPPLEPAGRGRRRAEPPPQQQQQDAPPPPPLEAAPGLYGAPALAGAPGWAAGRWQALAADPYTRNFLLLLLAAAVLVGLPWVARTRLAPALDRRRQLAREAAADAARGAPAAEAVAENDAARRRVVEAKAAELAAKAVEVERRKTAERAAEAERKLRDLRYGMESHYATDNLRDIMRHDEGALGARRARALEAADATQRALAAEEAARRAAEAAAAAAAVDRELAAREARLAAREGRAVGGEATPPAAAVSAAKPAPPSAAVAAAAAPAPAPAPRKRALGDEELAAARKAVATVRCPPEPDAGEANPRDAATAASTAAAAAAGGSGAAKPLPSVYHLVVTSSDWRGTFRLARRFRATDSLRAVMDAITAGLPGGMTGRQLCSVHPRRVLVSWRDYDLREYKFDSELARLRERAEAEAAAAAQAGADALWAPPANPTGLLELTTLRDALGSDARCALALRPVDADVVHSPGGTGSGEGAAPQ
jgi:hypothetical protein